jgi:hydroxylamine dehydrogenase
VSFRGVFIAIVIGTALLVSAFMVNHYRPPVTTAPATEQVITASGKCVECHIQTHYSVVQEYQLSVHAKKKINCLMCHQPAKGQEAVSHNGFTIAKHLTAANCRSCHEEIYQQFLKSRHAAPSWAAVYGTSGGKAHQQPDLTKEQVEFAEKLHPGGAKRAENPLVSIEAKSTIGVACAGCHGVGRPNADGTIGNCTSCHTRHLASVELARTPRTCGQCHMGPDHSQIEIYEESKHGILFEAQKGLMNLKVRSKDLTSKDMFVPTCATCHMSGINGGKSTHNPAERATYLLAAEVSAHRPDWEKGKAAMQEVCANCHTERTIEKVYKDAEQVVADTNASVTAVKTIVEGLKKDGLLPPGKFKHPLDFAYFDLWHYYGRTAKHGAYLGGSDFIQWHGTYPLLKSSVEIQHMAEQLRGNTHAK